MARWSLPSPSCLLEGHLVRGELVRQLGWQDSERDKVLVRQKSPELTEEQREVNLQRTGLQGCKLREACLVLRSPSGWKQHIGLRCCAPLRGCRCLHGVASFLTDRAPPVVLAPRLRVEANTQADWTTKHQRNTPCLRAVVRSSVGVEEVVAFLCGLLG